MKKLIWAVGLLCLIAVSAILYHELSAQSKTLADVTSPTGAWRLVVNGKDVRGGVEVTAVVHTHDGREISLGVIDMLPEWAENLQIYDADPIQRTRIDEVKAVVGDRVILRDTYFADEHHAVTGTIDGQPVDLRIGEVRKTGFVFRSGSAPVALPFVLVGFLDFPQRLSEGAVFEVEATDQTVLAPKVTCLWEEPGTNQSKVVSLYQNFSLRISVDRVTPHIVTGTVRITGAEPEVELAGEFRLVNELSERP